MSLDNIKKKGNDTSKSQNDLTVSELELQTILRRGINLPHVDAQNHVLLRLAPLFCLVSFISALVPEFADGFHFVLRSEFFCFHARILLWPGRFSFVFKRIFLLSPVSLRLIFPLIFYCFGRPAFFASLPRQTIGCQSRTQTSYCFANAFHCVFRYSLDLHTASHYPSPFKMALCRKLMATFLLPGAAISNHFWTTDVGSEAVR